MKELIKSADYGHIVQVVTRLAKRKTPKAIAQLKKFLLYRHEHLIYKHDVPRLACLALLHQGPAGVQALTEVFPEAPLSIYPTSIIEALWFACYGRRSTSFFTNELPTGQPWDSPLPAGTAAAAKLAIQDFIADSVESEDIFSHLMTFLHQESLKRLWPRAESPEGTKRQFRSNVIELLASGRIRITHRLLSEFDNLIVASEREEKYHRFLAENPVFLDPLASHLVSKQRLGVEHVTDFVVRRLDDKYVIVEIERPQDDIFTRSGDFSARFTHALGQILDFQQWIESNAEYARTLLPRVSAPRGLLIMGRSSHLSDAQKRKLHRMNVNSTTVDMLTYDDVSQNARRLHENIYGWNRKTA